MTDAEIMWALEVVFEKYSLNSCSDKEDLFQMMFKDSKIEEVYLWKWKCSYAINFDIAQYFRSLLQVALKNDRF